jgi:hypothetical protein
MPLFKQYKFLYIALPVSTALALIRCIKLLAETAEHVDETTHQILEPQNGSTAVFANNFEHLIMINVGRDK